MVDEKRDYITVNTGSSVERKDLFSAAESLLRKQMCTESSSTGVSISKGQENPYQASPEQVPKRPSNAFMIYSATLRKRIKTTFPEYNNSDISKLLGAMWKNAGAEVKKEYMEKANEVREWHKERYPDYEYNSRKQSTKERDSMPRTDFSNQDFITADDEWIRQLNDLLSQNPMTALHGSSQENFAIDYTSTPYFISSPSNDISLGDLKLEEWQDFCNNWTEHDSRYLDQNFLDESFWARF
ncbi:sex plus [Phycomyces blakesleeanus]|nr:sex plus [Phycomyces blakesleeanus]